VTLVAMWSGPRNISTAMMRAWENRPDTVVVDEPFYAAYLARTGGSRGDHPGRDEVIAAQPTEPAAVVAALLAPLPDGVDVRYVKHMTHHLLPEDDLSWVGAYRNVLLIRRPDEVVASYLRAREVCEPDDIGLLQQVRLLDALEDTPIVDAADFLRDPESYLRWLCDWLGIGFTDRMLTWPPGPRDSDGVWAPHWYDAVWASTGFEPYRPRDVHLDADGEAVAAACRPAYERLHASRLTL
jgi:Sulfotransferase domain